MLVEVVCLLFTRQGKNLIVLLKESGSKEQFRGYRWRSCSALQADRSSFQSVQFRWLLYLKLLNRLDTLETPSTERPQTSESGH